MDSTGACRTGGPHGLLQGASCTQPLHAAHNRPMQAATQQVAVAAQACRAQTAESRCASLAGLLQRAQEHLEEQQEEQVGGCAAGVGRDPINCQP